MPWSLAVLSPHLDDAALSLGATIAGWDGRVRVVTVLAGDPAATDVPGPWDAASGYASSGDAAVARREEDRRAMSILGAEPVWLPFCDEQYERGGGDDRVWDTIVAAVDGADRVLVPGYPLRHADHRWLHELVTRRRPPEWDLGVYVEQPYALRRRPERDTDPASPAAGLRFASIPSFRRERRAKRRACRAYDSQLRVLAKPIAATPRGLVHRIERVERARGGEQVAWLGRNA